MNTISQALAWAMQEVDIGEPANLRVRDIAVQAADKADRDDPDLVQSVRTLAAELLGTDTVAEALRDAGWETLVRGTQKLIRRASRDTGDLELALTVAIAALELRVRDANRGAGRQRRVLAAELLVEAAGRAQEVSPRVDAAIRKASSDPDEAVRAAVLGGVGWVASSAPDLVWDLVEKASTDDSAHVQAATGFALERLAQVDLERCCSIALATSQRITERGIRDGVQSVWISLLLRLYLATGRGDLRLALINFTAGNDDFHWIAGASRSYIAFGEPGTSTTYEEQARRLVHDLLRDLWVEAANDLDALIQSQEGGATLADADRDRGRAAGDRIVTIVRELYFGSGLHQDQGQPAVDVGKLKRFYLEYRDLLGLAAESAYPAVSYQLLQILEPLMEFDPEGVFLLAARSIASAERGGIQVEQMALDVIVRMVESCLSEYAGRVQQSGPWLRALREVVETFARVGWPRAFQLAYRLHEVLV